MKIRINCNNQNEIDEFLESLTDKYNVTNLAVFETFSEIFDGHLFAEFRVSTKSSTIKESINKRNLTKNIKVSQSSGLVNKTYVEGELFIYGPYIAQLTKIDTTDVNRPYKCAIYNDSAKPIASNWLNGSDLIHISKFTKRRHVNSNLTVSEIKAIKKDLELFNNN